MTEYQKVDQEYLRVVGDEPRSIPLYRTVDGVEPEKVDWLSPGRIPFGKLTVVEGDPGLGKTWLLLDLAARLTRGKALPGDPAVEPADVVLLTGEDGIADTIRPRLEAAGADLTRVHVLEGVRVDDERDDGITLPDHVPALQQLVKEKSARLVVADPLNAFLSGAVDSHKDHDSRRAMAPLSRLAEETGAAVVVVKHLPKTTGARAVTAGGGSIAFTAAARSVLLVEQDPSDAARRVLASAKCNLAPPPPSLVFQIRAGPDGAVRIEWHGVSEETADGLVAARSARGGVQGGSPKKTDKVADLLEGWLRAAPRERKEVLRLGRQAGFSKNTIERAAHRLNVYRHAEGWGTDKRAYWSIRPISPNSPVSENIGTNGTNRSFGTNTDSLFNPTDGPSTNSVGTNAGVGTNANSQGLTDTPGPLTPHMSQAPSHGPIDGDGRPAVSQDPATEEEIMEAQLEARIAVLVAMGVPRPEAWRRAVSESAGWGRFDIFSEASQTVPHDAHEIP